jgi:hypothetical protein
MSAGQSAVPEFATYPDALGLTSLPLIVREILGMLEGVAGLASRVRPIGGSLSRANYV